MSTVRKVEEILHHYTHTGRDKLIPILQEVQAQYGFLSKESLIKIGEHLKLPVSKVYGVATFYNQFRFKPTGKYHIMLCRGTACHVKGSLSLLNMLQETLGIKAGDTSRDLLFSIEVVACIGACGLAPVISINGEFFAQVTPDKLKKIIQTFRDKDQVNNQDSARA
ncbi:MAG: NADH-quinone oxidoreductase subunit NuoE [Pseudomonadota bacterium]